MSREAIDRAAGERAATRIRELTAPVRAPQRLRSAVAADRLASMPPPRRRVPLALAALTVAVAAALAALLVAGPSADPGGGSVADAAQAALRAPTAPPPARGYAGALALEVGGVPFPDYAREHGWRPVGTRTDAVAGRQAVTVTYARDGRRVGYTIVEGTPLAVPAGARRVRYEGVDVAVLREGATAAITWTRSGRTCVLSTRGTPLARMLDLVVAY